MPGNILYHHHMSLHYLCMCACICSIFYKFEVYWYVEMIRIDRTDEWISNSQILTNKLRLLTNDAFHVLPSKRLSGMNLLHQSMPATEQHNSSGKIALIAAPHLQFMTNILCKSNKLMLMLGVFTFSAGGCHPMGRAALPPLPCPPPLRPSLCHLQLRPREQN